MAVFGRSSIERKGPRDWRVNGDLHADTTIYHNCAGRLRGRNVLINVPISNPSAGGVFKHGSQDSPLFMLDTGVATTILTASTARALGLTPDDGTKCRVFPLGARAVGLGPGADPKDKMLLRRKRGTPAREYSGIRLFLARRGPPLDVHVKVPLSADGSFREGFSKHNLLGMRDVLSHTLICATPETVYFFPYRKTLVPKLW